MSVSVCMYFAGMGVRQSEQVLGLGDSKSLAVSARVEKASRKRLGMKQEVKDETCSSNNGLGGFDGKFLMREAGYDALPGIIS